MSNVNLQKQALLHALDIPIWRERIVPSDVGAGLVPAIFEETEPAQDYGQAQDLPLLKRCVVNCKLCTLHQTRTQTVFGVGNEKAKLMIIGEAPGFYEDQQGEPFVGRAGQLLNAMLMAIGLERSEIYIANILKCRPPNNRDPLPEEVTQCTPYLKQQIALIKPTVLCAVGRIAAHYLLDTTESLSRLRGKVHAYDENKLPLFITYHPAYLLRNPGAKADAYQDLQQLKKFLSEK